MKEDRSAAGNMRDEERSSPSKVQNSQPIDMSLVRGRSMHTVDARLDQSSSQSRERITGVDGDGAVLGLDPLPVALRVEDLQSGNRLAEQKRDGAQVGVAGRVELSNLRVVLGAPGSVVHVAKVVLSLDVVVMFADELVLVGELEENSEEAEELDDYFAVAFLAGGTRLAFSGHYVSSGAT